MSKSNVWWLIALLLPFWSSCKQPTEKQTDLAAHSDTVDAWTYAPRKFYGAPLEPDSGILIGAGQFNLKEFDFFAQTVEKKPVFAMFYTGLKGNPGMAVKRWQNSTDLYPWTVIPQIGLSMTRDGAPEEHYEHEVAAGKYAPQVSAFCQALKDWDVPVFVRIGYEFNGHWNGYQPASFIAAWQMLTDSLRHYLPGKVAVVWCAASSDAQNKDFMAFYPGDDYVDWFGVDIFSAHQFADSVTQAIVAQASARQKPIMIGETAPRYVGVLDGADSWDTWFVPFFSFMAENPGVKAFSYINADWSTTFLPNWGNSRLEKDAAVAERFRRQMARGPYITGDSPWLLAQ